MPEGNGDRETRLDRIERALELFIADHEQFRQDHKRLLTAQVLQKESIDNLLKITQEHTEQIKRITERQTEESKRLDERIDKLVLAIGDLIGRIPPQNLR